MSRKGLRVSVQEIRTRCEAWLSEQWQRVFTADGVIVVPHIDRTACFVEVEDIPVDGRTRINLRVPVISGIDPTPDLCQVVASAGSDFAFGSLTLYLGDDVPAPLLQFCYSTLGEATTSGLLSYYVNVVVKTGLELIDYFAPRVDGQTLYEGSWHDGGCLGCA
jgi:hypothetical protein